MVRGDRGRFGDSSQNNRNTALTKSSPVIDREKYFKKTCPFLLRVFCRTGSHHSLPEFDINHVPEQDEIQLYSWKNATLGELVTLLKEVHGIEMKRDNVISFKVVFYDFGSKAFRAKDVGLVIYGRHTPGEDQCLDQLRFVIGDYLSVAILPPQPLEPVSSSINLGLDYKKDISIRGIANSRSRRESFGRDGRNGSGSFQSFSGPRRFSDRGPPRGRDRPRSPYRRRA